MQYETIILELMSRIKVLEDEVAALKETVRSLESAANTTESSGADPDADTPVVPSAASTARSATPYTKMTEHMMDVCYAYGKKAYRNPNANLADYAVAVVGETNMNRNSAFMYICAVKSLLEGTVFKRAVSTTALRRYFSAIYNDFGKPGLANALKATRAHVTYRYSYNLPSDSIVALCDEFQSKL